MVTPAILRLLTQTTATIEDSWRLLYRYRAEEPDHAARMADARARLDEAHQLLRRADELLSGSASKKRLQ